MVVRAHDTTDLEPGDLPLEGSEFGLDRKEMRVFGCRV